MSTSTIGSVEASPGLMSKVADYVELSKPKISLMVLVSVIAAAVVASWGQPDPWAVLHALIGTTLVAASASALNQWLEIGLDSQMKRTSDRPLPAGRLDTSSVLTFAAITIVSGIAYLAVLVNWYAVLFGALTWLIYVWIYTPLKLKTPLNTHVGAVAGALPILIGWSATGADLDMRAWGLFFVVFLWQFPHFMAIAWIYRKQYGEVGMKMSPVVDPTGQSASVLAILGALALLPVSLVLPLWTPTGGSILFAALILPLGVAQLVCAIQFARLRTDASARLLLRASLIYLPTVLLLTMQLPLL